MKTKTLLQLSVVICLIACAIVRSAITTRLDAYTYDEPWHIAAGVSYVRTGIEGRGIPIFFLGNIYTVRAPFYFFPVVVLAKLPLGLIILSITGLILLVARKIPSEWVWPLWSAVALAGLAFHRAFDHQSTAFNVGLSLSIVVALLSALPVIRPWEYYNEPAGGANAYRYFSDEGIDMGQRTFEIANYDKERLIPEGKRPFIFNPRVEELDRIGVRRRSPADSAEDSSLISGTFLVQASNVNGSENFADFRSVETAERIGNVLVYRGTYDLPRVKVRALIILMNQAFYRKKPDFEAAERYARQLVSINPEILIGWTQIGNIFAKRGLREEAIRAYETAKQHSQPNSEYHKMLTRQLERISSEPLDAIPPIRPLRME